MRLINKDRIEEIKKAVVEVSSLSMIELETSRKHTVTPWATIGMYLIAKEGETADKAAAHFGRQAGIVYRVVKKIDSDIDKYQPFIDRILERVD